jgi:hypothetical protein
VQVAFRDGKMFVLKGRSALLASHISSVKVCKIIKNNCKLKRYNKKHQQAYQNFATKNLI